ncbi:hypothetical protein [Hyphomicrobium sp. CS1GBMeth3]|uniref:hypothetical protein n=1 Tax=Hyphomicrobium sp. CS1GBMeth3 TaxID=1892845 RepID=UPI0009301FC0|nr:hypothetical protein [Hyphomicrobium sp. CS1GBMeth3]
MKFWKVAYVDEIHDPDSWATSYAQDAHGAVVAHFKYLCERDPLLEEADLAAWPEGGGPARSFRVHAARVLTFSAEEMEGAHA